MDSFRRFLPAALIFGICALAPSQAQELLSPLNGGNPVGYEGAGESFLLAASGGGLFLVTVRDGALAAQVSRDGGASFSNAYVDFGGRSLTAVENVSLYERSCGDGILVFSAVETTGRGIYALETGAGGELRLAYGNRLDTEGAPGEVAELRVHPDRRAGFIITYRKAGALYALYAPDGSTPGVPVRVSGPGETVASYRFSQQFFEGGLLHYGSYAVTEQATTTFRFFTFAAGAVLPAEPIVTVPGTGLLPYEPVALPDGTVLFFYQSAGNLHGKRRQAGLWHDLAGGSPLNQARGEAGAFIAVARKDACTLLVTAGADLYCLRVHGDGTIIEEQSGAPLARSIANGTLRLYRASRDRYLLGVIEQRPAGDMLRVFHSEPYGRRVFAPVLSVPGAEADYSFTRLSDGRAAVQALYQTATGWEQGIFSLAEDLPEPVGPLQQRVATHTAGGTTGSVWAGDTLVRTTGGGTLLLHARSGDSLFLEDRILPVAAANGTPPFLLRQDGSGRLTLHAPPADRPAPAGALWTAGSAFSLDGGLCRVYFRDDQAPGQYTIEVQRRGYTVPVTWGGVDYADSGAERRYFYLSPGEEKKLCVEVWEGAERKGAWIASIHQNTSPLASPLVSRPPAAARRAEAKENGYPILQLSHNWQEDRNPRMHRGLVAWEGYDGHDWEIFAWQPGDEAARQITDNEFDDCHPVVDGEARWIAWEGRDGDWDIYVRDLSRAGGGEQVSSNPQDDRHPSIGGGVVAWDGLQNATVPWIGFPPELPIQTVPAELPFIYLWDRSQGTRRLTGGGGEESGAEPLVDRRGNVLWLETSSLVGSGLPPGPDAPATVPYVYTGKRLRLWDAAAASIRDLEQWSAPSLPDDPEIETTAPSAAEAGEERIALSDGCVLLSRAAGTEAGELALQAYPDQGSPVSLALDRAAGSGWGIGFHHPEAVLAWRDGAEPEWGIGVWNILSDRFSPLAYRGSLAGPPSIDETGNIAWSGGGEIYGWTGGELLPLTRDRLPDGRPEIDRGQVVWSGDDGQDAEIYLIPDWRKPVITAIAQTDAAGKAIDGEGWCNTPVTVTAQATDRPAVGGSGIAAEGWRHRIDYGDWLPGDRVVITKEGITRVDFIAADQAGNRSAIGSALVHIDSVPPAVSFSIESAGRWSEDGRWTNGPVAITLSATDDTSGIAESDSASWAYRVGEAAAAGYGRVITIDREGILPVYGKVRDRAGNWSAEECRIIQIDQTGPRLVRFEREPDAEWTSAPSVAVRAFAEDRPSPDCAGLDPATWEHSINGGPWIPGSTATVTAERLSRVAFRVRDRLGNLSGGGLKEAAPLFEGPLPKGPMPEGGQALMTASGVQAAAEDAGGVTVGIDRTPPAVRVGLGPGAGSTPPTAAISNRTIQAEDGDFLVSARDSIVIGEGVTIESGATARFVSAGTIAIRRNVRVKLGASVIGSKYYREGGWSADEGITAYGVGRDGGSGIAGWFVQVDDGPWGPVADPLRPQVAGFAQGSTAVRFKAVDGAGNEGEGAATVRLDSLAPAITIPATAAGEYSAGTITATAADAGSGVDAGSWQSSKDGGTYSAGNTLAFGATGTYPAYFRVSDLAGNVRQANGQVKIDRTPPTIATVIARSGATATVTASAADAHSGVDTGTWLHQIDGGAWSAGSVAAISGAGVHTVSFQVRDRVGNPAAHTGSYELDVTAPVITAAGCAWTNAPTVTATARAGDGGGSGVDPATWKYRLGAGGSWTAIAGITDPAAVVSVPVSLEGETQVFFQVADRLGNVGEASAIVRKDTTAPAVTGIVLTDALGAVIPQTNGVGDWVRAAGVTANAGGADGGGSGVDRLVWSADPGAPLGSWTAGPATVTAEGRTPLYFKAVDRVGLVSGTAVGCTVRIDRTAPDLTVSAPPADWNPAAVIIRVSAATDTLSGVASGYPKYSAVGAQPAAETAGGSYTVSADGQTTVTFRLRDAAGNETQVSRLVQVDRTAPGLAVSAAPAGWSKAAVTVSVTTATDIPSGVAAGYPKYTASGAQTVSTPTTGTACTVNTAGITTVVFTVRDRAGNETSVARQVKYDATAPVLAAQALSICDGAMPIPEEAFLSGPAAVSVLREPGSDGTAASPIDRYEYLVSDRWTGAPDFAPAACGVYDVPDGAELDAAHGFVVIADANATDARTLKNGTNYLYLRAVDKAGNAGPPLARIVRVDLNVPAAPAVTSTTHPPARSATEAVPLRDAQFRFASTAAGEGGISGYTYALYIEAGVGGSRRPYPAGQPAAGTTSTGVLDLIGLEDNAAGEYYLLEAQAVGGNRLASPPAVYRFRVDTRPPQDLIVYASPQVDEEAWYNYPQATFSWRRPALENSGVAGYRYLLTDDPVLIPGTPEEQRLLLATLPWQECPTPEREWNEVKVAIETGASGSRTFTACVIDTAGNLKFAAVRIRFDRAKPVFSPVAGSQPPVPLVVSPGEDGHSLTAAWEPVSDGPAGSGIARLETRLSQLDASGREVSSTPFRIAPAGATGAGYSGLATDAYYLVRARAVDNAGNESTVTALAALGDAPPVPASIRDEFSLSTNGFLLTGTRVTTFVPPAERYEAVVLGLPHSFPLEEYRAAGGGWETVVSIESESAAAAEDGTFRLTFDPARTFRFSVGGYTFTASGLSFSEAAGLAFGTVSLTITEAGGAARELGYSGVSLTLPPGMQIGACGELDTSADPIRFLSTYDATGGGSPAPAWLLTGIRRSRLSGLYWEGRGAMIEDDDLRLDAADPYGGQVKLTEVLIAADGSVYSAQVEVPFILLLGGNRFRVNDAALEGNRLRILEADLLLDSPDYQDREITVRYFSIDCEGRLVEEPGFSSEPVVYRYYLDPGRTQYATLTSAGIDFDGEVFRIAGGTIAFSGDVSNLPAVSISGLALTAAGPDWDCGAAAASFSGLVHGFPVSGSATLTATGLFFPAAALTLPAPFGGGVLVLEGLGLAYGGYSASGYAVYEAGEWTGTHTFTPIEYGNPVTLTRLTLSAAGLAADTLLVTLPVALGGGAAPFARLALDAGGAYGQTPPRDPLAFSAAGFGCTGIGAVFDGRAVRLERVDVLLQAADGAEPVSFAGVTLQGAGLAGAGTAMEPLEVEADGWRFTVSPLVLDPAGIHGAATLHLPSAFGSREAGFPAVTFLPTGAFVPGVSEDGVFARIHGWLTELSALSVSGDTLSAATATVRLYSSMGAEALVMPNLALSAAGEMVSCGEGTAETAFLSENGFLVQAAGYRFTAAGLAARGRVFFPRGLGEEVAATYAAEEIRLAADGTVTTPPRDTPVVYHLAGLDLTATDYEFTRQGLRVGASAVTVPILGNAEFIFPEIMFYADGSIRTGGVLAEGRQIPLFGLTFGITRIALTEDGLNLASFISLPPNLSGAGIYFDRLTIGPDGRLSTDAAIPEFGFPYQGFDFQFRNIRFDPDDGFCVGEAVITLPEAMERRSLRLINFSIRPDGSFQLGGLAVDPFEMYGFTFYLNDLAIREGVASFDGAVRLPDRFPAMIAGKTLDITDFTYDLNAGQVVSFDVSMRDPLSFPLVGEEWVVTADGIGIHKTPGGRFLLAVERGTLQFPQNFTGEDVSVDEVTVYGIEIDPATGAFAFDSLRIEGVTVRKLGCLFDLATLTISSDWDFIFSGSVTLPDQDGLPSFLRARTITVDRFEISGDGVLGDIDAGTGGLSGPLLGDLALENGMIRFQKLGGEYFLGLAESGGGEPENRIRFGSRFPAGIASKTLTLSELRIRLNDPAIVALSASGGPFAFSLFGTTEVKDALFSLAYNLEAGTCELGIAQAKAVLSGASFSASLRGSEVAIYAFRLNSQGEILQFDASLNLPGERVLIGDLRLLDARLGAALEEQSALVFAITGTLRFGPSFPQGIAGTQVGIGALRFDHRGELLDLDIGADFPDLNLLGTVPVQGAHIGLSKRSASDILIDLSGTLRLPANFPQGLAGLPVAIRTFSVSSSGQLVEVDIQAAGITASIWGRLELENGSVRVSNDGSDELLFRFGGDILLPSSLPRQFGGLRMRVEELVLSSRRGLVSFRAGNVGEIQVELFAGIRIIFTTVMVSDTGIGLSGSLRFPATFPTGLAGLAISLANLEVDWDGTVRDIQAGIGQATILLAGFTTRIEDLMFTSDGITIGSAILTLPPCLHSWQVGVRNAGFDRDGRFYGDIIAPDLRFGIAGFTVVVEDPELDPQTGEIRCRRAAMVLPDFLGGLQLELEQVRINSDGLQIGGAGMRLPDFTIAGGLGFKDVQVKLVLNEGKYAVDGGGKVLVPGAGTFGATIAFTDRSSTYPWGLKRAYFSYEAFGLGLPLAGTGLFINGIRGGLAFGPPDEIPSKVRWMFDEGTRLQLGLSLQDASAGNFVKANADVWVDITDWDWAFQGDVAVLRGIVKGEIVAALTGRGFYGDFGVELKFIRGRVTIYVYQLSGRTRVSGSGQVEFGMEKGAIVDKKIWRIRIRIPNRDWWFGSLGAEFGQFKNGAEGFKGYIRVPIWGTVGAFVPRGGGIKFGNVKQYELYTPDSARSPAPGLQALSGEPASPAGGRVRALDTADRSGKPQVYAFRVPAGGAAAARRNTMPADQARARTLALNEEGPPEPPTEPAAVERIVFVVAYEEGDPRITAVSPSGARYAEGHPQVEVERQENGATIAVIDPEPGEWFVEVADVLNRDCYGIEVYGTGAAPDIELHTPAGGAEQAGERYEVRGRVNAVTGTETVRVYLSRERDSYIGEPVAELAPEEDGGFRAVIDTSALVDGEYYVFAGVTSGDDPEKRAYAGGSLMVAREQPLRAVERLIGSPGAEEGELAISFSDPNGSRTLGFRLYLEELASGKTETIWLGYLTNTVIPGFQAGDRVRFRVAAVDTARREGALSEPVTVTLGGPPPEVNGFRVAQSSVALSLAIGAAAYRGTIVVENSSPQVTATAADYLEAAVLEAPPGLAIGFDEPVWNIARATTPVGYTLRAAESMSPGIYPLRVLLANRANRDLRQTVSFSITVGYPPVALEQVRPQEWNTLDGADLELIGDNFYPGTRVYLDDQELVLAEGGGPVYLKAHVPAGAPGGEHALRVIGPGGDERALPVTVLEPTYTVTLYKSRAEIPAGEAGGFPFAITGENRYSGAASFTLAQAPDGWTVSLEGCPVSEGRTARLQVEVPTGAALGEYSIRCLSDRSDELVFTVVVNERYPDPALSSIVPGSALPAETVRLYGYGFGDAGTVRLNQTVLPVLAWSRDEISVQIPEGAVSGPVIVERDGLLSNLHQFYVKSAGFRLYAQEATLALQPGESRTTRLAVNGYAPAVSLSADSGTPLVLAALDPGWVTPNAVVELRLEAAPGTPNGSYPVTIEGSGGGRTAAATVTVVVGQAFAFRTASLPAAMEQTGYRAQIETEHGEGRITFSLAEGKLPLGLSLNSSGLIGGKPTEVGERNFIVSAEDERGRRIHAYFSLKVEENAWAQTDKDAGRSRYNPVPTPADGRRLWVSAAFSGADEILTGRGRVLVRTPGEVIGLEAATGALVYRYPGNFRQWAYGAERLFLLDGAGVFQAVDVRAGNLLWSREAVRRFTTDGNRILLEQDAGVAELEASSGLLVGELPGVRLDGLDGAATLLWRHGELLRLVEGGLALERLAAGSGGSGGAASWQRAFAPPPGSAIREAAADEAALALLLDDGTLLLLDEQYAVIGRAATGLAAGLPGARLVLGAERIAAAAGGQLAGYRRTDLERLFQRNLAVQEIAGGAEKLFAAGPEGLAAVNGYTGAVIWTAETAQADVAIAGERVYGLDAGGRVSCYHGPDNLAPPFTRLLLQPAEPDGAQGYYISAPQASLAAEDAESYAAETWYRISEQPLRAYEAPFTLPDGRYTVVACSVDNHGWREPDRLTAVQVDTAAPQTSLHVAGSPGENGYHLSALVLSLSAADAVSGVEHVEYRLGAAGAEGVWRRYSEALTLSTEGAYPFAWRAQDVAGNLEEAGGQVFRLDLADPSAQAHATSEPGLGAVYLEACDSFSGVNRIEYRADGGPVLVYLDPITFTQAGDHRVSYRAVDNAGRACAWQEIGVSVPPFTSGEWIRELEFAYRLPGREVVRDVQAGERMFAPAGGHNNRIERLPEYLAGADFIRLHLADGSYRGDWIARFTAGADIDVYILKHPLSQAGLSGWELGEERFPVQPTHFFEGGADVYRRSFRRGERVELPAARMPPGPGSGNLYFVQYRLSNYLKIVSPEPGVALVPLATVRYAAVMLSGAGGSLSWACRPAGEAEWTALPAGLSGALEVPYVEGEGGLELKARLEAADGGAVIERVQAYRIENRADLVLEHPGPGGELAAGRAVGLVVRATDAAGRPVPAEAVAWAESRDGAAWSPAALADGFSLQVPVMPGAYYLKGSWAEAAGRLRERTYRFQVVEALSDLTIRFGAAGGIGEAGESCLGETVREQPSGRIYGFTADHTGRAGRFVALLLPPARRGPPDRITCPYIALQAGEAFLLHSGQGRFKVQALLGPLDRPGAHRLTVNGRTVGIDKRHGHEEVFEVVTEASATGGRLRLEGSADLPLMSLTLTPLSAEAPPVADTVGRRSDIFVLHHSKPGEGQPPGGGPGGGEPPHGWGRPGGRDQ